MSLREDSLKSASASEPLQVGEVKNMKIIAVDPQEERRIVRKLDYCLIPLMTIFYLLSFLDRANIGNARVAGLQKDLGLTDRQYQICITVLYVPYIIAELPSNLLLRRLGPNLVMPSILTIWGMVCALQGVVTTFQGLATVRAFLGLVEGPMFPGIVLYLSSFYTRKELSLRIALFFSAASLSGAFSGLLAAAIVNMHGVGGRAGWAWIFILEGSFTVLVGLLGFFFVPSTPNDLKFMTQEEREFIIQRLHADRPTTTIEEKFSFREVWRSLSSPQVLLNFVSLFMAGTTLYGLALFLPSIVNQLGYSATHTQLVSVGPFAAGFFVTIITSYVSDRYSCRALVAVASSLLSMVGFIVFLKSTSTKMAYGSLFLSVSGVYPLPPILSAWMANNSEPHYRRATSVAFGFVATNAGGILSTWSFPTSESPRYTKTTIMDISFCIIIIVFSTLNVLYLNYATHQKERNRGEILAPYITSDKAVEDGGEAAWIDLGDRHPDFQRLDGQPPLIRAGDRFTIKKSGGTHLAESNLYKRFGLSKVHEGPKSASYRS